MYIYEITRENKIRFWDTEIFAKVPGATGKVLFRVHDLREHAANQIDDIWFPIDTFMKWNKTYEPDCFDLENSIMIADETKEIKPLKIGNIWAFIQAGNWEKYEELKKVMNP